MQASNPMANHHFHSFSRLMCFFVMLLLVFFGTLRQTHTLLPICSMYGIFTYIWVIYGVNVGIHIPYMGCTWVIACYGLEFKNPLAMLAVF